MALKPIFMELSGSLHRLDDALKRVHVTLGDKPSGDESALADGVEAAVLDLMGLRMKPGKLLSMRNKLLEILHQT